MFALADRLHAFHWLGRDRADREVRRRLAALIRHAGEHVPYYREAVGEASVRTEEDAIAEELRKLPALTKDHLQNRAADLLSDIPGHKTYENTSGGSTGTPARFVQDAEYKLWNFANKLLFNSWAGYRLGDRHLRLWGAPRDIFGGGSRTKERIRSCALNEYTLNCYQIKESTWQEYAETVNRLRPIVIEAYADAAYDFSLYINTNEVRVHEPKGIVTSAGVLTEAMERQIKKAFHCPVLNRYGSREVGDIACSCGQGRGLHVSELTHVVEVVDEEGLPCEPGREGDVLVTLLTNTSMPLIRYQIGDRAVWAEEPCACGRSSKVLARVTGRTSDYVVASDLTRINGTALTTVLYGTSGLKRFQFHQSASGDVTLTAVPVNGVDAEALRRNLQPGLDKLRVLLGEGRRLDVRISDSIATTETGKHRYVISKWQDGAPAVGRPSPHRAVSSAQHRGTGPAEGPCHQEEV